MMPDDVDSGETRNVPGTAGVGWLHDVPPPARSEPLGMARSPDVKTTASSDTLVEGGVPSRAVCEELLGHATPRRHPLWGKKMRRISGSVGMRQGDGIEKRGGLARVSRGLQPPSGLGGDTGRRHHGDVQGDLQISDWDGSSCRLREQRGSTRTDARVEDDYTHLPYPQGRIQVSVQR